MNQRRQRIRYLNTDLELYSREDLEPLDRGGAYRLHVETKKDGQSWATLEVEKNARGPNGHMTAMLKIIENLKPAAREIWDRCDRKEFNIGFESGNEPSYGKFNHMLPNRTLKRLAAAGAVLVMTIYPPDETLAAK